jgi:hypothetical protein
MSLERRSGMKVRAVLPIVLLLSAFVVTSTAGEDKKDHQNQSGKNAGLEQFKQLAGEWVGKEIGHGAEQAEVHINYKVTSAGHTVVETIFPGTAHEMVTVIHPDGDDLVLTHYCALGNQPQMKAKPAGDGNSIAFKFTGATNMKSDRDMHMHDATYTFVDKDTLKSEWTTYMDGKPGGKVVFDLKRKK